MAVKLIDESSIQFLALTLRLGGPDNVRFVGEWILPFDPNVVFLFALDVIFLDGLSLIGFCSFLSPHQVNRTEFLDKNHKNSSSNSR